jgi:hypothetical protein
LEITAMTTQTVLRKILIYTGAASAGWLIATAAAAAL